MALDTSVGRQFSVDQLVDMAYRKAGLMDAHESLDTATAVEGRKFLELILDNLQNRGFTAKEVKWVDVAIVASTASYTLASDVLDVQGNAFLGTDRQPVDRYGYQSWVELTDTGDSGTPNKFVVQHTGTTLQVTLAPIPTQADTLHLLCRRLLSDCRSGQATLDMERGFNMYLVTELAGQIADAKGKHILGRSYMKDAANMIDLAMGRAREGVECTFEIDLGAYQ
jgi:hypothetical protein